jgi:hypothetical protein
MEDYGFNDLTLLTRDEKLTGDEINHVTDFTIKG